MDWIILNLITNKRHNNLIYGVLLGVIILDFINDQIGFINEKYLVVDWSLCAIVLFILKEILNFGYKRLYNKNKQILANISHLMETGHYSEVIKEAEAVKIIKPHVLEKNYWVGVANVYLNRPQQALQVFSAIESAYQTSGGFYYHRALANYCLGAYQEAISDNTKVIEIDPSQHKAYYNRALCKQKINEAASAAKDFETAKQLKDL